MNSIRSLSCPFAFRPVFSSRSFWSFGSISGNERSSSSIEGNSWHPSEELVALIRSFRGMSGYSASTVLAGISCALGAYSLLRRRSIPRGIEFVDDQSISVENLVRYAHLAKMAYFDQEKLQENLHSKFPSSELLDCQWNSLEFDLAFFITYSKTNREISISIRGTDSLNAIYTNSLITPKELSLHSDHGPDLHVHAGILEAARKISANVVKICDESRHEFKRLTFTGHSLGGAVAAISSVLLHECKKHSNQDLEIYSIAFGPPPCVVFKNLCALKNMICVVNGDDIIPRFRIEHLLLLKKAVEIYATQGPLALISSIARNKIKIESTEILSHIGFEGIHIQDVVLPADRIIYIHPGQAKLIDIDPALSSSFKSNWETLFFTTTMISDHFCSNYIRALESIKR